MSGADGRDSANAKEWLFYNISELMTCGPMVRHKKLRNLSIEDIGILRGAWLHIRQGKVEGSGEGEPPRELKTRPGLLLRDLKGALVLPGLVDSHTHPVFSGNRSQEFAMRINGLSYQEIARQGGGISASVRASREAGPDELKAATLRHLQSFLSFGVTSVEAKSGYGLSVAEELRQLRLLRELRGEVPQTLVSTCLALHSLPPEHSSFRDYVNEIHRDMLPLVAEEGLADYCDAFIEKGYFSVQDCDAFMKEVKKLGLGIRVHADEFSDAGGAAASAEWGAASADHLQFASDTGIQAMARAGVTATVLPGTSLYTAIPYTQARRFADAGCPVAIASDFNPGSCYIKNLPFLASVSGLHCGLKSWEVMAGITLVPAHSLGLGERKGALVRGYDADFLIHPAGDHYSWLSDFGQSLPAEVWHLGKKVMEN